VKNDMLIPVFDSCLLYIGGQKMSEDNPFAKLDFESFRKMASDPSLSMYEKIGFPNSYRQGYERVIFEDIRNKLAPLRRRNQVILDIGPGCSEIPRMLLELCRQQGHQLIWIDSPEMLRLLPDADFICKIEGCYPKDFAAFIERHHGKIDGILFYSVLHYVFDEGNIFEFLDKSLSLLNIGGQMLIGDIPNVSKRKRFFSSENGIAYHKNFSNTDENPQVEHLKIEAQNIDDAVLFALMLRARYAGFDSYLLPQAENLPLANRREDLLLHRP
jgi:hypothetical protein